MQRLLNRGISPLALMMLLLIGVLGFAFLAPQEALALTTSKITAQPNADDGNGVLGAKITRVTWEGTPEADEVVTGVSITLPEGTDFAPDRCKATLIVGEDQAETVEMQATFTKDGQTLVGTFANAQSADGGYLRIQIYDVIFPKEGGVMTFTGEYTLEDGTTASLGLIPEINVTESTWGQVASTWLEGKSWVQAWNSVTFLNLFFNPAIAVRSLPSVFGGFLMALGVVAVTFPLAIPFGLVLALMRMAKSRVPRAIATFYVNIVRGTPLFLQIYIVFFGLPLAGIDIPAYVMAVMVLGLNTGAYLCEIFRAGIQSIPKGQFEASRSLGMSGAQTMMFVIIPQTVRRVIPTMTSEFILLYKDTSLLASVGFMEIIMFAKSIVATTGSITPYIVAALFYLLITLPLAKVVGILEARLSGSDGGTASPSKKKKAKSANKSAIKAAS